MNLQVLAEDFPIGHSIRAGVVRDIGTTIAGAQCNTEPTDNGRDRMPPEGSAHRRRHYMQPCRELGDIFGVPCSLPAELHHDPRTIARLYPRW
jgi:hypothetical protein